MPWTLPDVLHSIPHGYAHEDTHGEPCCGTDERTNCHSVGHSVCGAVGHPYVRSVLYGGTNSYALCRTVCRAVSSSNCDTVCHTNCRSVRRTNCCAICHPVCCAVGGTHSYPNSCTDGCTDAALPRTTRPTRVQQPSN